MTASASDGPIRRFLAHDHDRLDTLLRSAVTSSGEIDREAYDEFRAGLLRHIGIEEKILFPASRRANGGIPHSMEAQLHREHGALALLLVPAPTVAVVEEIRAFVARHNEREESADGTYAFCDRLLGDEMEALLDRLRRYPPVKVAPHFDGPEAPRRADDALRAVSRKRRPPAGGAG